MTTSVVIGATGDVGRGIVPALLHAGHDVVAIARNPDRLAALAAEFGSPAALTTCAGSLAGDADVTLLRDALLARPGGVTNIVVSVNGARIISPLFDHDSDSFAQMLRNDLVSHYTAIRALLPILPAGGVYLGIGGGSADFILEGGAYMSVAQAGLRMMYRALAHELRDRPATLRQLIVASVVNGATTRAFADPAWVTDREIGDQVAAMLADPAAFPDPVWRIARRDESGSPVVTPEGQARTQGFRS